MYYIGTAELRNTYSLRNFGTGSLAADIEPLPNCWAFSGSSHTKATGPQGTGTNHTHTLRVDAADQTQPQWNAAHYNPGESTRAFNQHFAIVLDNNVTVEHLRAKQESLIEERNRILSNPLLAFFLQKRINEIDVELDKLDEQIDALVQPVNMNDMLELIMRGQQCIESAKKFLELSHADSATKASAKAS